MICPSWEYLVWKVTYFVIHYLELHASNKNERSPLFIYLFIFNYYERALFFLNLWLEIYLMLALVIGLPLSFMLAHICTNIIYSLIKFCHLYWKKKILKYWYVSVSLYNWSVDIHYCFWHLTYFYWSLKINNGTCFIGACLHYRLYWMYHENLMVWCDDL